MGSTWLTNQTSANTTKMRWESNSYITALGINGNMRIGAAFGGSIDLNSCYININGNSFWQGVTDGTSSDYDFTVGGSSEFACDSCIITTADGRTKEIAVASSFDVTDVSDGDYSILKDYSTGELSLASLTISPKEPASPNDGDYWLNNAQIPLVLKTYDTSVWVTDNDKVYLGDCTIASGVVSALSNNKFNNGWNTTTPHIVETYQNGTSYYRVYSDGWCEQGGVVTVNAYPLTVSYLKTFKNTDYLPLITYIENTQTQRYTAQIMSYTTTSMTISPNSASSISWKCAGYVA